jgi:L-alanine-DL-glutamate epimerase-like enolase superfamily enzyme
MKVTEVDIVRGERAIPLPEPWRAAWREPSGEPVAALGYGFYRVYTDEGITGIGPYTGCEDTSLVEGVDPFHVEAFWDAHMSGRRLGTSGKGAAGLEIALWDIIGKALGQPVHRILGVYRDKILAYAATSRLLEVDEHVRQVLGLMEQGFKAVKLRLHRPDPMDDLKIVEAVRTAAGDDLIILVDANQNNFNEGYDPWSRETALEVAERLQELHVYLLEEPRPRKDVEGLAKIADAMCMLIAGGEHSPTIYDFREHILRGAYDIIQPDVIMGGNTGITGIRRDAIVAGYFGKLIVPHVISSGNTPLGLAATLQAMATVDNCPMVEYPCDPPILTTDTLQAIVKEPILIDEDGYVQVPDRPGIGVEIDEEKLSAGLGM